jgi:hypothetical protein
MVYRINYLKNTKESHHAAQVIAPVQAGAYIFPPWDDSTVAVERLYGHMLADGWAARPPQELPAYEPAVPLPRRTPRREEPVAARLWTTQQDEIVTYGDFVALDLAEHADAVGRIVDHTSDNRIQCILLRCNGCQPGAFVTVTEDQLIVRVPRYVRRF